MKSERAKHFLDCKSPVHRHPNGSTTYYLLNRYDAERAIDLAEQETEVRMCAKAHKIVKEMMAVIFQGDMPQNIAEEFIQKLKEDEVD